VESRWLGITFLSASHAGGRQHGFQHGSQTGFSYNPEFINPYEAFFNYIQKEFQSKGMALAMIQRDSAHTNNINIFCFHVVVEGLVLHVCLSLIQVTDKMVSKMDLFYNPELINTDAAFLITYRRTSIPKGWLWQWYKRIQLTHRTSIYSVSIGE